MDCYFITNANQKIGMGHLVRCIILADALLERDVRSFFITSDSSKTATQWIENRGYSNYQLDTDVLTDAPSFFTWLQQHGSGFKFLVFDTDLSQYYEADYQRVLRSCGLGVMFITFFNPGRFEVDILHNQNPLALDNKYDTSEQATLLLGLQYTIMKREFREVAQLAKEKRYNGISTILLTFGGSDSKNLSQRVLKILDRFFTNQCFTIHLIVGALNSSKGELLSLARRSVHNVQVWIDTDEMPRLMLESDIAVSSGGITLWELACCKTMNVVLPTSEREIRTAKELHAQDLVDLVGRFDRVDDGDIASSLKHHERAVEAVQEKVDAFYTKVNPSGVELVAAEILRWYGNKNHRQLDEPSQVNKKLDIQLATAEQYQSYHSLRSEAKNLFWTGYSSPPDFHNFREWYLGRIKDDSRLLYLAFRDGLCVGSFNVDIYSDYAMIGYSVSSSFERMGFGTFLLNQALKCCVSNCVWIAKAWIHEGNVGSQRVAEKNGLQRNGVSEDRNWHSRSVKYHQYEIKLSPG